MCECCGYLENAPNITEKLIWCRKAENLQLWGGGFGGGSIESLSMCILGVRICGLDEHVLSIVDYQTRIWISKEKKLQIS